MSSLVGVHVSSVKTLLTIYNESWSYGCVACGTGVFIHFILHEQGTLNEVVRNLTII